VFKLSDQVVRFFFLLGVGFLSFSCGVMTHHLLWGETKTYTPDVSYDTPDKQDYP